MPKETIFDDLEISLFTLTIYHQYYAASKSGYEFAPVLRATKECSDLLFNELKSQLRHVEIHKGLCATADSFYSSQGRIGSEFKDKNENVISELVIQHPTAEILEMEVYPLYHLADISSDKSIKVIAAAMVFADRKRNTFLPVENASALECEASKAFLEAIIKVDIAEPHLEQPVWKLPK